MLIEILKRLFKLNIACFISFELYKKTITPAVAGYYRMIISFPCRKLLNSLAVFILSR